MSDSLCRALRDRQLKASRVCLLCGGRVVDGDEVCAIASVVVAHAECADRHAPSPAMAGAMQRPRSIRRALPVVFHRAR